MTISMVVMRYKGAVPKRLVSRVNGCVLNLRSSRRFGRLVSRYLTVVTYTGRRSGRTFSTPVGYRRTGDGVVEIAVMIPERKAWWRNFTGDGGPLSLELDGDVRTGHAVAQVDEKSRVKITVRLDDRP